MTAHAHLPQRACGGSPGPGQSRQTGKTGQGHTSELQISAPVPRAISVHLTAAAAPWSRRNAQKTRPVQEAKGGGGGGVA